MCISFAKIIRKKAQRVDPACSHTYNYTTQSL